MKKLYASLLFGALIATGATGQVDVSKSNPKTHSGANLEALSSANIRRVKPEVIQNPAAIERHGFKKDQTLSAKAKSRSAVAIDFVEGDWDYSYYDYFDRTTVHGTVTFLYSAVYEQFLVLFDQDPLDLGFWADFDASTGTLTFYQEYLGSYGAFDVFQAPLTGTDISQKLEGVYNEATKTFEFPSSGGLGQAVVVNNQLQGYNYLIQQISITKPDGDFSLKLSVDEECTPDHNHRLTFSAGADIADLYMVAVEGDEDPEFYAAEMGEAFFSYNGMHMDYKSGSFTFNPADFMEASGYYTMMAGGYDANGALRKTARIVVYVNLPEEGAYQTIATVPFADNIVSQYYNSPNYIHNNLVLQENVAKPGLYRLVNAYAGADYVHSDGCDHYIYLDASDPEFVNIPVSSTGADFGDGILAIGTFGGALGYSKAECQTYGYAYGSLSGRTITFPVNSVLVHESKYNKPGLWNYLNDSDYGCTPIVFNLPDLKLEVTVVDADNLPVENAVVEVEGVSGTTDDQGKVTLTLPATVDYLATVTVRAMPEEGTASETNVQLNGADNAAQVAVNTSSGIDDILDDADNTPVEYFNLQGVRIANPAPGQVVIRRQGSVVSKVLVK